MPETAVATQTADTTAATTATTTGATTGTTAAVVDTSWRSTLPEPIRADATLSKYTDVPALAQAHIELQKKLGIPTLPKPSATWTEKEWGELHSALGRPDKPEGYGFKPLENLPAGMTASPEQDKWFSEQAYKLGLNTAQATALRDQFVQYQVAQAAGGLEAVKAEQAKITEGTRKLEMEYGTKWSAAIDGAQKVVQQFGTPELQELLKTTGLHQHPAVMGVFAKIGQVLMDHSVITGVARMSGSFTGGPAAAQAELQKMEADPANREILMKASHPRHDELVKRRSELQRAMVPVEG